MRDEAIAGQRTCSKCGETKPLDEFHRDSAGPDGRSRRCADCACAATRQWLQANGTRNGQLAAFAVDQRCSGCKETKPIAEFYRDKTAKSGFSHRCKQCSHAGVQAFRKRYPERVKAEEKRRRNKRRAFIDSFKTGLCVDCGGSFPPYVYDFDHVRGEKTFRIANWVANGGFTREEVTAEIAKCELRCSNCHRIRHWQKYHLDNGDG